LSPPGHSLGYQRGCQSRQAASAPACGRNIDPWHLHHLFLPRPGCQHEQPVNFSLSSPGEREATLPFHCPCNTSRTRMALIVLAGSHDLLFTMLKASWPRPPTATQRAYGVSNSARSNHGEQSIDSRQVRQTSRPKHHAVDQDPKGAADFNWPQSKP
jgi:hypothetical protein